MSLADKLASERRGRLAAERMLELKQAELYAANRKLGLHARALSEEIVETRGEVANVRAENERFKSDLNVANQKIEVAERRLWHSINTIQDGFAFFDNDDCLIAANEAYLVVFDGLEEVVPGVPYARILQLLTEEGIVNIDGRSAADWRADMMARRQSLTPDPVVIRMWNDQYIKMVDHRNASGDLISLGLNITSTVIYERELKQARKKAEEAARAKSVFLANMSHEIRTPMNGVVGMAELLADTKLNDEQQLYAETIRNSGEALLVIINDILDYSKIEAEKLVLMESAFDLEKTIQEVLMLLQPAAREKGISLLLDYDMFLTRHLMGDVGRVRQILTNLIGNAVKFTLEGHVLVRISGVPSDTSAAVTLHVAIEDTGIGIPADKVEHIFGQFTQVDDERNRQFEGTGLGLAITQRLIEMMRGDVWVTSEQGVGSCFGFRIVLDQCDTDAQPPPRLNGVLNRAMVVDDMDVNREILLKQLEFLGIAADGFSSAEAALGALDPCYDLIVTDHVMAGLNGPDFVRALRARAVSTPVLMISSNVGALEGAGLEGDVAAILQRPLTRDTLIATLTTLGAELNKDSPGAARPVFAHRAQAAELPAEPEAPEADTEEEAEPTPMPLFRARKRTAPPPQTQAQTQPQTPNIPPKPDSLPEPDEPNATKAPPHPPEDSVPRRMRILAAEDNKTNQLVFRKMVKHLEIDLTFANNGLEAVQAYADHPPDLIFMDISMPHMDGKEATREIRRVETQTGTHVPIVALTAHAMTGDSDSILAAGLDHYLTKPLRKPAIQEMILRYAPTSALPPMPQTAQAS